MVIAMIFRGHLLPYSWLYNSNSYLILSIIIPILSLIVGLNFCKLFSCNNDDSARNNI